MEIAGSAKVLSMQNGKVFYIYIPARISKALNMKKGNILNFKMENPQPDYIEAPKRKNNFRANVDGSEQPKDILVTE